MCSTVAASKDDLMKTSIMDAASKLFQQFGLAKTTMEDIARSIGKGKSSLYYYYATKEDIFVAVVEREKDLILKEIQDAVNKETTAEGRLRTMAHTKFKALQKRMSMYNIDSIDMPDRMCLYKSIGKRYDEIELSLVKSIIVAGIEDGEFKNISKASIIVVSTVFANSLKGLQFSMTMGDYSGNTNTLINATIDILVNGIKLDI